MPKEKEILEAPPKMGLAEVLCAIRSEIDTVQKNGNNTFHRYKYATANDIFHEVRDTCSKHGLGIIPMGMADFQIQDKDKGGMVLFGQMQFLLIAPNGEQATASIPCAGEDKGDKSPYKAITGALKYLFISLFQIPTEDDPEKDTRTLAKKQAFTNGNSAPQQAAKPKVETINKAQINELLELANKVPKENQDDNFTKTYSSIQEGTIPASKFENAKVYLQLAAKAKQAVTQ